MDVDFRNRHTKAVLFDEPKQFWPLEPIAGLFIDDRICDNRNIRPLVAQKRVDLIREWSAFLGGQKARSIRLFFTV